MVILMQKLVVCHFELLLASGISFGLDMPFGHRYYPSAKSPLISTQIRAKRSVIKTKSLILIGQILKSPA